MLTKVTEFVKLFESTGNYNQVRDDPLTYMTFLLCHRVKQLTEVTQFVRLVAGKYTKPMK